MWMLKIAAPIRDGNGPLMVFLKQWRCLWPWVWPFKVIQHRRSHQHKVTSAHIWFTICVQSNNLSKVNGFRVIKQWKFVTFSLTFQGHPISKVKSPFESSYYDFLCVSDTNYVSKVNGFRVIKHWKSVTLSLTFQGHPISKVISPFESQYMISYMCLIQTMCLQWMVLEL